MITQHLENITIKKLNRITFDLETAINELFRVIRSYPDTNDKIERLCLETETSVKKCVQLIDELIHNPFG